MSEFRPTPIRDGFAALWSEPRLLLAELVWRWCFGLCALTLVCASIGFFLDSLTVSKLDQWLLRSLQPQLMSLAFQQIFRGSVSRLVLEQAVLLLGITLLWSFASAAGRAAILRRLVAMFSRLGEQQEQSMVWHLRSIFLLHLLRVMWTAVAIAVGALLFVYGNIMAMRERPLPAALALSFGVGIACVVGFSLNWYLGVAPLFCIRDEVDARSGFERAIEFSARHGGRLFLMGSGYCLLHLVWAGTMWLAFVAPLSLNAKLSGRWTALSMVGVALVYCAGSNCLKLTRLAAYVSLAEDDAHPALQNGPEAPLQSPPQPDLLPLVGLA